MEMYKNLSMSLADNGGYNISYDKSEKREGAGVYSEPYTSYKKESFGPSESAKAFARFEELKKECCMEMEEKDED